jgi:hypothetical protein
MKIIVHVTEPTPIYLELNGFIDVVAKKKKKKKSMPFSLKTVISLLVLDLELFEYYF